MASIFDGRKDEDVIVALYRAGRDWGKPYLGALLLPTRPLVRYQPRGRERGGPVRFERLAGR
jgi:hypothetical protein